MTFDPSTGTLTRQPAPHELVGLALELGDLGAALGSWPPVGERLAGLQAAMRGDDGISRGEVERLRRWSRIWATLPEHDFWIAGTRSDTLYSVAVKYGLHRVLDGERPEGALRGAIRSAYEHWAGEPPPCELFPPKATR